MAQSINAAFESEFSELTKFKDAVNESQRKESVITDVCQRFDVQIKNIDERVEKLEWGSTKRKIILSGLSAQSVDKKEMINYLQGFFELTLGIRVKVDDYFFVGAQQPKSIVIALQTFQDKKLILHNKRLLKNVKDQGRKLYINDYVPSATQEKRRRKTEVFNAAVNIFGEHKVTSSKGGIIINGNAYKKQVLPPTPT